MRTYTKPSLVLGIVAVLGAAGAGAGCKNRGTSIDPALKLLPPDTQVVAVVDLAVARKNPDWGAVADPLFRLLAAAAPDAAKPDTDPGADAKADPGEKSSRKKKAKLTGPLAVVEALMDDLADAGKVDPRADLDAIVLGITETDEPPLVVVLGRGFSDKGLEAVLDARDVTYDSDREKGIRYHTFGDTAVAVLDEHTFIAGDEDAVQAAIGRSGAGGGATGKSAADSEKLRPALDDVERPAAAYAFGLPEGDLLDVLEDDWGVDGADGAKSFAAWVQVEGDLFHIVVAGRAASDEKAASLAVALEDALSKARKTLKDAPRPFAKLVKEPAVVARGAEVLVSLDVPAARFLREVEDDAAAAEMARAFVAGILPAAGPGSGGVVGLGIKGSGGGLDAATTTALLGPLSSFSELVILADVAALRGIGLPASLAALRDRFASTGADFSLLERFVAATGFDPLRDVSSLAVAVERVSLSSDPQYLVSFRGTGLDLEKLWSFLTAEGRMPSRETYASLLMIGWDAEAAAILASGVAVVGKRAHVIAALESDGHRGEALAPSLPPAAPIIGVYSGAFDPMWTSGFGGFSMSGVSTMAFAASKEGGSLVGRSWFRGEPGAIRDTCDSLGRAITSAGPMVSMMGLKASMDGTSCLAEARVPASLVDAWSGGAGMTEMAALLAKLGSSKLPPPDPWALPPPPPSPGGSMADWVAKVKADPGLGTRGRPITVTAIDQEYEFLRLMTCGGSGTFTAMAQKLISDAGRSLDEVEAVCTTGGEKRTFYFDVTSIFGGGAF